VPDPYPSLLALIRRRCICAGVRANSHEAAAALRRADRCAKHSAGDRRANHGQAEEAVVEMHREVTVASECVALASPQARGWRVHDPVLAGVASGRSRSCSHGGVPVAFSRALPPRNAGGHVRGDCPFVLPRRAARAFRPGWPTSRRSSRRPGPWPRDFVPEREPPRLGGLVDLQANLNGSGPG
jgi:hypothetical protein